VWRNPEQAIAALATATGRGAVGIVRVSGPALGTLVQAVCGVVLTPRHATYLPFLDAQGETIDRGLALFFPAPHSYTGEEVLELQAHGFCWRVAWRQGKRWAYVWRSLGNLPSAPT
jgi:tRNA modification GTPase